MPKYYMRNVRVLGFVAIAFIAGTITSSTLAVADTSTQGQPFQVLQSAIQNLQNQINNLQTQINHIQLTPGPQGQPGPPGPQGPPGTSNNFDPTPLQNQINALRCHQAPTNNVDLHGCDLTRLWISHADFYGANLGNANLNSSIFDGVSDFDNANLTNANLIGVNIHEGDFVGANLTNATLTGANLSNAAILDATLTNAHFYFANLSNVIFNNSNLSGANFTNANLSGATFTGVHASPPCTGNPICSTLPP
jgi:uncharacterized protein YjbI with pentapeptide repeats